MIIRVTQEHINKGVRGSCRNCPVALAMEDAGIYKPRVGIDLSGTINDEKYRWFLPKEVARFMHEFDNLTMNEAPFEFEIPDAT